MAYPYELPPLNINTKAWRSVLYILNCNKQIGFNKMLFGPQGPFEAVSTIETEYVYYLVITLKMETIVLILFFNSDLLVLCEIICEQFCV